MFDKKYVTCIMQCAGNKRIFTDNKDRIPWYASVVNGQWSGAALSDILYSLGQSLSTLKQQDAFIDFLAADGDSKKNYNDLLPAKELPYESILAWD